MRAHHRHFHAFGGFEGVFGPLSAATIGHPLGWNPAFCAFAFRVLPFESVSSRPDGSISCSSRPCGSFSCRFCGFQEGAFSMASSRGFRGSKGTLGPCRAVCLWRVGLESCWGSAVSHPYGSFSWLPSVCGGFVFDLFPAVRTGAFRADFVASKKVRFRWLPTGVLGVQRVR